MRRTIVVAVVWVVALPLARGATPSSATRPTTSSRWTRRRPRTTAARRRTRPPRWQTRGSKLDAASSGLDSGECASGAKQCSGETPQTCSSAGQWVNGTPCKYVCSAGTCTGTCVPTTMRRAATPGAAARSRRAARPVSGAPALSGSSTCVPAPAGWVAVAIAGAGDAGCPGRLRPAGGRRGQPASGGRHVRVQLPGNAVCAGSADLSEYVSGTCAGAADKQAQAELSAPCVVAAAASRAEEGDGVLVHRGKGRAKAELPDEPPDYDHACGDDRHRGRLSRRRDVLERGLPVEHRQHVRPAGGSVACPPGFPTRNSSRST